MSVPLRYPGTGPRLLCDWDVSLMPRNNSASAMNTTTTCRCRLGATLYDCINCRHLSTRLNTIHINIKYDGAISNLAHQCPSPLVGVEYALAWVGGLLHIVVRWRTLHGCHPVLNFPDYEYKYLITLSVWLRLGSSVLSVLKVTLMPSCRISMSPISQALFVS